MAKALILGIPPSDFEGMTAEAVRAVIPRVEKHREREYKAESEEHKATIDAVMKAIGNMVKAQNNTNELLAKLLGKPTI